MSSRRSLALAALLRQAALTAETCTLPPGSTLALPAALAAQLPLATLPQHSSPPYPLPSLTRAATGAGSDWRRALHASAPSGIGASGALQEAEAGTPSTVVLSSAHLGRREAAVAAEVVEYLVQEVGLALEDARTIADAVTCGPEDSLPAFVIPRPNPSAVTLEGVKSVVQYLKSIPGVQIKRAVWNSRYILWASREERQRMPEVAAWLTQRLGLRKGDLGRIVSAHAAVLARPVAAKAKPAIDWLQDFGGWPQDTLRRIVVRHPLTLAFNVSRLEQGVDRLKRMVDMSHEACQLGVCKFIPILWHSEHKVRAVLDWLQQHGVQPQELSQVVALFPSIVSYSIHDNLDPKAAYFCTELGMRGEDFYKLVLKSPDTLGRSLDRLRANAQALREAGLSAAELARTVAAYPGILRMDVSCPPYSSKLRFLREELDMDPGPAMAVHPMYLTYSLERIATRACFLKSLNRSARGLTAWLSANETIFVEAIAKRDLKLYATFKAQWALTEVGRKWLEVAGEAGRGFSPPGEESLGEG